MSGWVENKYAALREHADGDPDSQESKIVRVLSSLLSEISEDSTRQRAEPDTEGPRLISNL